MNSSGGIGPLLSMFFPESHRVTWWLGADRSLGLMGEGSPDIQDRWWLRANHYYPNYSWCEGKGTTKTYNLLKQCL